MITVFKDYMYLGLVDYYEFKGRNDVVSEMYVFMLFEKLKKLLNGKYVKRLNEENEYCLCIV